MEDAFLGMAIDCRGSIRYGVEQFFQKAFYVQLFPDGEKSAEREGMECLQGESEACAKASY